MTTPEESPISYVIIFFFTAVSQSHASNSSFRAPIYFQPDGLGFLFTTASAIFSSLTISPSSPEHYSAIPGT
jgi:hypothetical protein